MNATARRYEAIDVHTPTAAAWPQPMPELTGPEAVRAARRLWRFAMGTTFAGPVNITHGNRANAIRWQGSRLALFVNPSRGWKNFVHEFSHEFVFRCNPQDRPHSKFHVRFESKLVREVIRRGYLDGKLRDKPKAAVSISKADTLADRQRDELARIDAAVDRWERKRLRAVRALAKLAKRRRYYASKVAS